MRKMCNLIINEYVKIFSKVSTIVMLIGIIILAIGYNALMFFSEKQEESFRYTEQTIEEPMDHTGIIKDEETAKQPGWEDRVALYKFMKDNNISWDGGWKSTALDTALIQISEISEMSDESQLVVIRRSIEIIKKAIVDNDWKTCMKEQINIVNNNENVSKEEKEIRLFSLQYQVDHDLANESNSMEQENGARWEMSALGSLENYKRLRSEEMKKPISERDKVLIENYNEAILIETYRLENNIDAFTSQDKLGERSNNMTIFSFWDVFENSIMLISVINLLIIIVAGSIISSEFSSGTIKFLLINPVKRWKILVAKYISILTIGIFMLLIYYIVNAILSGIFFGFSDISAPYLFVSGDNVREGSSFLYVASKYLLGSVGLLTMATFAFAISSLFRNSALSIGLSMFLMLSGNGIVQVLGVEFSIDWARYLIFANTNINAVMNKQTPFLGHTVTFAFIVIAVYMVVFLLTAWDGFMRRDIR